MTMFFGARTAGSLPYFGPLSKIPNDALDQHLVFSREDTKEYVQDRMMAQKSKVAELLKDSKAHIYICGLRQMEVGVEKALASIAKDIGQDWNMLRDEMRENGRYHVETY
jgi:benzoyl-CoA 2,3-dioxygenase component A